MILPEGKGCIPEGGRFDLNFDAHVAVYQEAGKAWSVRQWLVGRPVWALLVPEAQDTSLDCPPASSSLPFIYSPSLGSGCLGQLLLPWGAWLSLWSSLPGTDCPGGRHPFKHHGPHHTLPNSPRFPVHYPLWPSLLLWGRDSEV